MKTIKLLAAATAIVLLSPGAPLAHDDDEGKGKLGTVKFDNSCDPKVQVDLQRGVAMLHSFWYSAAEQTFRQVLAQDPNCVIAAWGAASILMSNPLAGVGATAKNAEAAQALIAQGRKTAAKTQRERDYLEAVAAYYDDWSNRPERTRQLSRAKAY